MEYVFPSSNNDPLLRIFSPNKGSEIFVSSRQEELPFFKHFPSPFLDDISTAQLAPPQHTHLMFPYPNKRLNIDSTEPSSSSTTPEITPKKKKRSGKKDRHSKIRTVHGLRDRRMRLSLEISRKFFDLQDMLGFDKASKTIDWLFSKSKKAIKEVTLTLPLQMKNNQGICIEKRGESPLSKREAGVEITEESKARVGLGRKLPRKSRDLPTLNCNAPVARESREKARARARERTREKMLNKCLKQRLGQCEWFEANPNSNLGQLGLGFSKNTNLVKLKCSGDPFKPSWSSHSHSSQDRNFSLADQFASVEIIEKLLGTSCSAFGYLKSSATIGSLDPGSKFLEFLENRDAKDLKINPNTNVDPFTATVQGQNPSYNPMTSFNMNFHSQHPGGRSVQFP